MLLKNLVIGSDLTSIVYAFINDYHYLVNNSIGPLFFEQGFALLGKKRLDYTWSRLQILLSLQGKLLNYDKNKIIRLREREIKISQSGSTFKYEFEKCEIFDPTGLIFENMASSPTATFYEVYDDFELSCLGKKHKFIEPKLSNEQFAKEIHYYTSSRVDGANYVTDCVVKSRLTHEQIMSFDFSDTMARFAVDRHLTSLGIRGNFMNLYKNGSPKYRRPKILHKKRLVTERDMNKYVDSETIKFLNKKMENLF